jgi:hypothetical protein
MDEYIKRKEALALVRPDAPEDEKAVVTIATAKKLVRSIILRTPAADVALVVHCRSYNKPRLGWCSVHLDREGPDDFCSYGVRMDGDDDVD